MKSMETKTVTLKSGIVIKDSRTLGCGISFENQNTKYINLGYSSERGFYLNIKGLWITEKELSDYFKELEIMSIALLEANTMLNK